jgi:hypothetical protein
LENYWKILGKLLENSWKILGKFLVCEINTPCLLKEGSKGRFPLFVEGGV